MLKSKAELERRLAQIDQRISDLKATPISIASDFEPLREARNELRWALGLDDRKKEQAQAETSREEPMTRDVQHNEERLDVDDSEKLKANNEWGNLSAEDLKKVVDEMEEPPKLKKLFPVGEPPYVTKGISKIISETQKSLGDVHQLIDALNLVGQQHQQLHDVSERQAKKLKAKNVLLSKCVLEYEKQMGRDKKTIKTLEYLVKGYKNTCKDYKVLLKEAKRRRIKDNKKNRQEGPLASLARRALVQKAQSQTNAMFTKLIEQVDPESKTGPEFADWFCTGCDQKIAVRVLSVPTGTCFGCGASAWITKD